MPEFDRRDVARLRERFSNRQRSKRMMIVDHASGDSDRAHLAIDVIVRLREFLLHRGGERDDFERRTRFVDILQRPVGSRFAVWLRRLCSDQTSARLRARGSRHCADRARSLFLTSRANVAPRLVMLVRPDTESTDRSSAQLSGRASTRSHNSRTALPFASFSTNSLPGSPEIFAL